MTLRGRLLYDSLVRAAGVYQRLFSQVHVWGKEHIPPGPKIYAANHVMSFDAYWLSPVFPERVHYIVGPMNGTRITKKMIEYMEFISSDRAHAGDVVARAAAYLAIGESVAIWPEGNLQKPFQLGRFYPGAARMHLSAHAPLVPIGLVAPLRRLREFPKLDRMVDGKVFPMVIATRGTYCINVGEPWMPKCPNVSDMRQIMYVTEGLRERIGALVEDVRRNKFWLET